MTKSTTFICVQEGATRRFSGILLPAEQYPIMTVEALINAMLDLRLTDHATARSLWGRLWRSNSPHSALDDALGEIETIMTAYARPGYEFTAWFIDGSTFWGWFPMNYY